MIRRPFRIVRSRLLQATALAALLLLPACAHDAAETHVMSFNIRYANPGDGEDRWERRQALVVETIMNTSPDLLGIQEALPGQYAFLRGALDDYATHGTGRRADGTGEAVPLFWKQSRYALTGSGHFWLSETPKVRGSKSWDSSLPRMVSWVRLLDMKNENREILVANTHFDHRGEEARLESAQLLRGRFGTSDLPLIIMGDFNADEGSAPYRALLGAGPGALLDSYRSEPSEEDGRDTTFHGFRGGVEGKRIDWILHSHHWVTTGATINRTNLNGRYPSDHYPISAILEF